MIAGFWAASSNSGTSVELKDKLEMAERNLQATVKRLDELEDEHSAEIEELQREHQQECG